MAAAFYGAGEVSQAHAAARAGVPMTAGQRIVQVVGHAAVACAGAVASGGQCGPAAAAQAFTSGIGTELPDGRVIGTAARATVGGIAAKIAGGESREGALTAAYAYLFNDMAIIRRIDTWSAKQKQLFMAQLAENMEGSEIYGRDKGWGELSPTESKNKCNLFLHDRGIDSGIDMPSASNGLPIRAWNWASLFGADKNGWIRVFIPQRGDIVASGFGVLSRDLNHVGIYLGEKRVASSSASANGTIVVNDWAHRIEHPAEAMARSYWQYVGK